MLVASGVFCLRVCPASSSGLSPPTPPPPCRQTVENLGNARDLKGRLVAFRLDLLAAWRGQSEPSYTVAFVPAQQLQPGHANLRLMSADPCLMLRVTRSGAHVAPCLYPPVRRRQEALICAGPHLRARRTVRSSADGDILLIRAGNFSPQDDSPCTLRCGIFLLIPAPCRAHNGRTCTHWLRRFGHKEMYIEIVKFHSAKATNESRT